MFALLRSRNATENKILEKGIVLHIFLWERRWRSLWKNISCSTYVSLCIVFSTGDLKFIACASHRRNARHRQTPSKQHQNNTDEMQFLVRCVHVNIFLLLNTFLFFVINRNINSIWYLKKNSVWDKHMCALGWNKDVFMKKWSHIDYVFIVKFILVICDKP